jgi:tetratricopeptide (TPR) repeat protein
MKAVTFAAFALALILASPGDAKDIIDASTPSPFVAPVAQPDRPHLKRGDSGGDVPILQKALNSHGERLTVDGFFGPHTERAVKDFQAQSGLVTTGEVDSGTWGALATEPPRVGNPTGELDTARQAADRAKAQAEMLAKQVASLTSELGIANAQRNELQIKLDLARSEAESAKSQLKDKQSDLEGMQSELKIAKQDAAQAKATATATASLTSELGIANAQRNELQIKLDLATSEAESAQSQLSSMANVKSELEKANVQRNELQTKLDQGGCKADAAQSQFLIRELQSELESAREDAEQVKVGASVFAHLCAVENEDVQRKAKTTGSGDLKTSDSAEQPATAFAVNEQPPAVYVDTPDTPAIATAEIKIGDILKAQGDLVQALKSYQDGLAVANRVANADPKNTEWQQNLTLIYLKVGEVFMAQGNFAEALKSYQDGLAVADLLAKSDPENVGWQRTLSVAYNRVGDALAAEGNLTEASQILEESLAIRERLAKTDSSDTDSQRDLAISQGNVAAVLAEQGDTSRALDLFQRARGIIAGLVQQSPHNAQLSKDLAVFDDNIARLKQASTLELEARQPRQAVK